MFIFEIYKYNTIIVQDISQGWFVLGGMSVALEHDIQWFDRLPCGVRGEVTCLTVVLDTIVLGTRAGAVLVFSCIAHFTPFNRIFNITNSYTQHNHGYGSYYCDLKTCKCHIDETLTRFSIIFVKCVGAGPFWPGKRTCMLTQSPESYTTRT